MFDRSDYFNEHSYVPCHLFILSFLFFLSHSISPYPLESVTLQCMTICFTHHHFTSHLSVLSVIDSKLLEYTSLFFAFNHSQTDATTHATVPLCLPLIFGWLWKLALFLDFQCTSCTAPSTTLPRLIIAPRMQWRFSRSHSYEGERGFCLVLFSYLHTYRAMIFHSFHSFRSFSIAHKHTHTRLHKHIINPFALFNYFAQWKWWRRLVLVVCSFLCSCVQNN